MLTGKEKRYLKGLSNGIKQRYLIGKGEINDSFVKMIDDALEAKELIKIGLNPNCELSAKEAGESIAKQTDAELVQVIGKVAVLYRKSKKAPKIVLPN